MDFRGLGFWVLLLEGLVSMSSFLFSLALQPFSVTLLSHVGNSGMSALQFSWTAHFSGLRTLHVEVKSNPKP